MLSEHVISKNFFTGWWMFWAVVATTILSIGISIYCLNAGTFIVFQNVLYVPIVLACVGYPRRGFVFSVGLAVSYYLLVHGYTHDSGVLHQAQARTVIFIIVAGVVAYLSHVRKQTEGKLERLRCENELILQSAKDGIFGLDAKGNHTFVNSAAAEMLGWSSDELLGKNSHAIWHHTRENGSFYPEKECPIFATLQNGLIHQGEDYFLRQDGTGFPVEFTSAPKTENGKIVGAVVTFRDITERKKVEKALQLIISNVPTAIFRGYADWRLEPENEMIESLTGYSVSEFTSGAVKWSDLIFPEDLEPATAVVVKALRSEDLDYTREYRIVCRSGEMKWIRERSNITLDSNKRIQCIVGVFHDVTEDIQKREKVEYQAIRDPLTGLLNRLGMEDSFDRELDRARRKNESVGVIMLDIDHFKLYNDTYGHLAGDKVLCALGKFLLSFSRRYDISCRFGGEELLIILPGTSIEVAHRRAEELWSKVQQLEIKDNGSNLPSVNVSLGVAVFPEHGATATELIRAADQALYRAKEEGRDRVVVAQ